MHPVLASNINSYLDQAAVINTTSFEGIIILSTLNITIIIIKLKGYMEINNINIQNCMQSPHNKKLFQFREKLSKLQSPQKKQTQHSFIKQLHKRNKLIQKDIQSVLDSISQHYFESQQIITQCTRNTIAYLQQKQSELLQQLDAFKQKQLDLIKDDIENFLKGAKKVKKIVTNGSLEKLYKYEKLQKIYDNDQTVKNILAKLNKLKPHSEKMNQKISNYTINLKSFNIDYQDTISSGDESQQSQNSYQNIKLLLKQHKKNPKNRPIKKSVKHKQYISESPKQTSLPIQDTSFPELQSPTKTPNKNQQIFKKKPKKYQSQNHSLKDSQTQQRIIIKKRVNDYLLSSKSQQFINTIHNNNQQQKQQNQQNSGNQLHNNINKNNRYEINQQQESNHYNNQRKANYLNDENNTHCSIQKRLRSYEQFLRNQPQSQLQTISDKFKQKNNLIINKNYIQYQSEQKDTNLMEDPLEMINNQPQKVMQRNLIRNNRSMQEKGNITNKTSMIAYSNNNPKNLQKVQNLRNKKLTMPKIPSPHQKLTQKQSDNYLQQNRQEDRDNKYGYQLQMQQNYRQNLQRNSHYDQNQVIKDQFRTQIENFKNSLGKNNLHQQINSDYQNNNKYDDMRNLTKIRSQETIKVINNFDKVPKSSQRKIQTNRNPEKYNPNKDQITSVRSLDRLDRLKNTAISAGNTSRTAKHNNWMRILKQQQLKYNQVKEKIQF